MKKKFLAAVMALVMIGTTPVGVFADTMVKSYLTGLDVPILKPMTNQRSRIILSRDAHRVESRMPVLCMRHL